MKLKIKGERDKQLRYTFIGISALALFSTAGTVITGSLAWYFAMNQKTITTPMTFNHPFSSDALTADATGMVGQNFTLFIQTERGSALSLNVSPQPGSGRTLRFTPVSPPLRKNEDAKTWEEGQTYEKTLVTLSRAVVNGQVPDEYEEYPVSRMTAYAPAVSVRLTPERQFVGNHLRVVRFRLTIRATTTGVIADARNIYNLRRGNVENVV